MGNDESKIKRMNMSPFQNLVINGNPKKVAIEINSKTISRAIFYQKCDGYNLIDLMILHKSFRSFNVVVESKYFSTKMLYNIIDNKTTMVRLFENLYKLTTNHGLKYSDISSLFRKDSIFDEIFYNGRIIEEGMYITSRLERLIDFQKEDVSGKFITDNEFGTFYDNDKRLDKCIKQLGEQLIIIKDLVDDFACDRLEKKIRNMDKINDELYKIIEVLYNKSKGCPKKELMKKYSSDKLNNYFEHLKNNMPVAKD